MIRKDTAAIMLHRFADTLRDIRLRYHLTQVEMAARMGVSQPSYSSYESGRHYPRLDTVYRLSAAFGIPICELLGDPEPPTRRKRGA